MPESHDVPYDPEFEGFGTTYEAFHFRRKLYSIVRERGIKDVCEYPVCTFRVPGIVSAYLAAIGCDVTLATSDRTALLSSRELFRRWGLLAKAHFVEIDVDRLGSERFDMVFHTSVLSTMERDLGIEPMSCLREMARLSRKWVVVTNHNLQYSIFLDRLFSRLTRSPTQFGDVHLVGERPVRQIFRAIGLEVCEEFLIDIPPWPALDISKLVTKIRSRTTNKIASSGNKMIEETMRRYSFIETAALPRCVKALFAHHVGTVGMKTS